MIEQFYLCPYCYGPICFPWGQKVHIGTGWYCWNERDPHSDGPVDAPWPLDTPVDPDAIAEILDRAEELFDRWKKDGRRREVFTFMRRHLRNERADVLHGFLGRRFRDEKVGAFFRHLMATEEWEAFRRAQRKKALAKRKRARKAVA